MSKRRDQGMDPEDLQDIASFDPSQANRWADRDQRNSRGKRSGNDGIPGQIHAADAVARKDKGRDGLSL